MARAHPVCTPPNRAHAERVLAAFPVWRVVREGVRRALLRFGTPMDWLESARTSIVRFMAREGEGFNVVAVDSFELPGEGLYLVGNYPSRAEATAAARAYEASGDRAHVYGPPSRSRRERLNSA